MSYIRSAKQCNCKKGLCIHCGYCNNCECECSPTNRRKKRRRTTAKGMYADCENSCSDDDVQAGKKISFSTKNSYDARFEELLDFVGKKKRQFKNIPSQRDRETAKFRDLNADKAARLLSMTLCIIENICHIIFPGDPGGLLKKIKTHDFSESFVNNSRVVVNALPRNCVQSDVILSVISKSFDSPLMKEKFDVGKIKIANLRRMYSYLASGSMLQPPKRSLQHYKKTDVEQCIRFILSDNNVQRISWGTKKVMIDGEELNFPKLIRRKVIQYIHRDYVETIHEDNRISMSSFRNLAAVLTASDQKAKKAVDYVSGMLLYDNFERLRLVVSTAPEKDDLLKLTHALESFMKAVISDHICSCNVTDIKFAFTKQKRMKEFVIHVVLRQELHATLGK